MQSQEIAISEPCDQTNYRECKLIYNVARVSFGVINILLSIPIQSHTKKPFLGEIEDINKESESFAMSVMVLIKDPDKLQFNQPQYLQWWKKYSGQADVNSSSVVSATTMPLPNPPCAVLKLLDCAVQHCFGGGRI